MFEPINFVKNLVYMGKGMLGILIVMAVVVLMVKVLNTMFSGKKE